MKLKDLKIGTQLRLGLGAILVLVVALGVVAWLQTDILWLQTKDLYDHPLTVRRALGELEVQVLTMQRDMKDLCQAETAPERETLLQDMAARDADAHRQFTILYDRYLGPRSDIEEAEQAFVRWQAIRDETRRLLREGKTVEAINRTRSTGTGGGQVEKILGEIKNLSDFAKNKGDQFYAAATAQNDTINRQLAGFVTVILLLTLGVAWLLLKGIKGPLAELTAATEQFRQGQLDARSGYAFANEFGALSASFNTMAEAIQTEMRVNEQAAQLAGVMLREEEVPAFCRELLKALLQHTGSQVGAVYFLNEAKTAFEHFASIGLGTGGRAAFSATALEGELGAAVATRQIQRITDIPADTRFAFAAVSGEFQPREILTIPVLSDHSVSAVISLASVRAYDAASLRLVNDIWSVLTARVNGVLAFRKIQDLATALEHQNRELDAQKRELVSQAAEVTEQNSELEMQKRQIEEANRLKSAFLSNMSHELRTPLNSVIALSGVLSRRLRPAPVGPGPSPGAAGPGTAGSGDPAYNDALRPAPVGPVPSPGAAGPGTAGSGDPAYNDALRTIPAEEYGYLEVIERNGQNLLSLINDILDLSRIEAGREEISVSQFSVRELAGELVAMLEPQAVEKQIALRNQVPADLPLITTDPDKLRHILQNLVGNAVKFTERGQVTVRAECGVRNAEREEGISDQEDSPSAIRNPQSAIGNPQSEIRISVTDTGIGIAADQLPYIFDEFRQADGSTSRKYGGTGLGLAIAKKFAQLLGGRITVESAPGQGSTFTLRLPLVLDLPHAAPPATFERTSGACANGATPAPAGPGQSILVVEDNEPAIIQLTHILSEQGYRVQVARNGQEALAQIAETVPAAMILDLMMPGVDGFQVLNTIRGTQPTAHLPILILTAKHVTKEELSVLKGNRIHQLIQKGDINKAGLLATVARMVAPPPAPPVPRAARRRPTRPGKPVILVVEDNPDSLRTARALLGERYQVIEATDGRAGLEQARQHQPDLILMDIGMPVMDGVQALEEIRRDETLRHIPVIAATASAMKGDRETILAHGFDGYVTKPLEVELLLKTLHAALD